MMDGKRSSINIHLHVVSFFFQERKIPRNKMTSANSNIPLEQSEGNLAQKYFTVIILRIITKMFIIYGILVVEHVLHNDYTKIFPEIKVVKMIWRSISYKCNVIEQYANYGFDKHSPAI
jgi:hypothetical protein